MSYFYQDIRCQPLSVVVVIIIIIIIIIKTTFLQILLIS